MKINNILVGTLAVGCLGTGVTSCSDGFLQEDLTNIPNAETTFKTQEGLDQLVVGTYSALKFKFNYNWAYTFWPMGTDEFTDANNEVVALNGYMINSTFTSTTAGNIGDIWNNMFNRIEAANSAIENIPQYYSPTASTYNTRLGEAYFLRAFCYFTLVQQYGGVPLKLSSSNGTVVTDYTRSSAEETYAQLIADFEKAYELLPKQVEATGRISKYAAAHFIAKAKLFRQSELNASWGAKYKESDLADVIAKSDSVIAAHPLCSDFVELWDYNKANDNNETVSEIVLAAQFSDDQSTWGRYGNQLHLAFPAVYQDMDGTKRDISGDREFCYLRTTNYTLDVFDRVNDSRFWKSFITTYGCNYTKVAPNWKGKKIANAVLPEIAESNTDSVRFKGGDIAIRYIVNDPGDTEYEVAKVIDNKTGQEVEAGEAIVARNGVVQNSHTFVRYMKGDKENWYSNNLETQHGNYGNYAQKKRFVALSKYRDGYRINISSQFGTRDGIIARSAEDVLFAAEAYARLGNYAKTVEYINKLRDRAAYKAGENRALHVDGGQAYMNNTYCQGNGGGYSADGAIYCSTNTYYESNKLEGREQEIDATDTKAQMHLNGVDDILNSERDNKIYNALTDKTNFGSDETFSKVMNFILNERTRELCGEMQRWIDLSRCKALKGRWEAFNDGCGREGKSKFEDYMNLRPIPQTDYLDAITTPNASEQQNPGY